MNMSLVRFVPACLLTFTAFAGTSASSPTPELRGILATGKELRFALVASGGGHTTWAKLGETFNGWAVAEYIAKDQAVVVTQGGKKVTLLLNSSSIADGSTAVSTPATVEQANDLLGKMKFEAMWDTIATEQKKAIVGSIRPQVTAELKKLGVPQPDIETVVDKMGDAVIAGLQSDVMRQDFARIYAEVYTQEELRGVADFHDTAAGKAWTAKQPEVQQKLMQAMMPRVMEGMPAAQKLVTDYLQQRASGKK